jgi:hypothetical protein
MMLASSLTLQDSDFPTDVDFKWAQDSYNVTQRNIDTWLFFGTFRSQLWLLDQKWSYAGGFTGKELRRGWCCVQAAAVSLANFLVKGGWAYMGVKQCCQYALVSTVLAGIIREAWALCIC